MILRGYSLSSGEYFILAVSIRVLYY